MDNLSKTKRILYIVGFVMLFILIISIFVFTPINSRLTSLFTQLNPRSFTADVSGSGSGTVVIFLTSGTTWTVPSDWDSSNNKIEVIGGGGGGGSPYWFGGGGGGSTAFGAYLIATGGAGGGASAGCSGGQGGGLVSGGSGDNGDCSGANGSGGGGGAYSKAVNVPLIPGAIVNIYIGAGGQGGSYGSASGGSGYHSGGSGAFYGGGGGAGSTGNGGDALGAAAGGPAGTGGTVGSVSIAGSNGSSGTSPGTSVGGVAGGPIGGVGGAASANGSSPGGGGGGVVSAYLNGGSGANGEIVITYMSIGGGGSNIGSGSNPPGDSPDASCVPASQVPGIYYVTPSGAGCKNGADWNNAFARLPAILVRGSAYYIASGNYGFYTFNTPESGASVITIKKATTADHGTSVGWNDGYAAQAVFTGVGDVFDIINGYLTIDGVYGSGTGGHGFKFVSTGSGDWNGSVINIPSYTSPYVTVNSISIQHVEIQGQGVSDGAYGIHTGLASPSDSWSFQYDYIHDVYIWIATNGANDVIINNNYLQNAGSSWPDGQDGQNHHGAGLVFGGQNVTIKNNVMENMIGTHNTTYIEPQGSEGTNIKIYGNVFWASSPDESTSQWTISLTSSDTVNGMYVYNNTFYGMHGLCGVNGADIGTSMDVIVENNVFQNCSNGINFNDINQQDHNILNTGEVSFQNASAGNFQLTNPTSAGVTLPSPYDIDPAGNIRGANGNWDIGAYQYGTILPTCTSFSYSAWSSCGSNSQQTRIVTATTPTSCTGGSPVLTQSCTPSSTPDTTAPSIPTNLATTSVTSSSVGLSWSASTDPTVSGQTTSGLAGYKVYRGGTYLASVTSGTTYTDSTVSASTAYTYTVSAYDTSNNESNKSSSVSVTTSAGSSGGGNTPPSGDSTPSGSGGGGGSLATYTLTVSATNGSILKIPNQNTYTSGTSVTLTATPKTGYIFSSWSGDLTGLTNPTTIVVNSNKSITANFVASTLPSTNSLTPTSPATSNLYLNCAKVVFNRKLVLGSYGQDVKCLQSILNQFPTTEVSVTGAGSPGKESMILGLRTLAALRKYQAVNGLTPANQVGPRTTNLLNKYIGVKPTTSASSSASPTAKLAPAPSPNITSKNQNAIVNTIGNILKALQIINGNGK